MSTELPDMAQPEPQVPDPDGPDVVPVGSVLPLASSPADSRLDLTQDMASRSGKRLFARTWFRISGVALLGLLLTATILWNVWDAPSTLVAQVMERRGLDLVEEHAERLRFAAAESDVDVCLLAGIMYSESRGRGGQTSHKGALGLMQLSMAAASDSARRLGLDKPTKDQLLEDADLNVRLAADHLAWLLRHAGEWDLEAVLVSYNAGRSRLFDWISDAGGSYAAWRARELQRKADGDRTTGALDYALQTLAARDSFRARGVIDPSAAGAVPKD